ncbi:outer membrane protein transport protein [Gillisia sp. M10.2A]|uniref:Outer membrane protein transport protein n=1 Tax=Gillisia lutea TaxID=2909668 RepID=A0ABS9ELJ9_9FLAO|nr:outer membrane protein transport protein [Gillisia lutea]MCF4102331.1 outer membrane protein transport protein [Gillisia lutea]
MKKIYTTAIALLAMAVSQAQDITDAVRYSQNELNGTARFRAMSGAFGALGGDLSAIAINPASSAVYLNSSASFTLNYRDTETDARYFNGFNSSNDSNLNLDQAGAVLVFNSINSENNWNKFTLAANYSQQNNFENDYLLRGASNTSIDQYFLSYADGVPLELLETIEDETISDLYRYLGETEGFGAQQALLGYQAYIIDPQSNDTNNTIYNSNIAAGSFDQQSSYNATGLNGKLSFNFATQYQDFLYLGLNLNPHFWNYDRSTQFYESNSNQGSETSEVLFVNNLSTTGNGFSLQLGAIAKVNDYVRLGLSYDSPTWFTISEETSQRVLASNNQFSQPLDISPNIVNVFPDYKLKTPGKLTGSMAILFGDQGLISFDYSYKDFSKTELRPSNDPDFAIQNAKIKNELKAASTYRIGGEYRIMDWRLRGGYRYEESPYENESTIGNLSGYSIGAGYNFGKVKLDLAYDNATRTNNPQLFQTGLTNTANIQQDISSFVLTLSFGI